MPDLTIYDQRAQAVSEARQILDRADRERRELSADEQSHYDRIDRDIDRLNDEIAKRERAQAALKAKPKADAPGAASRIVYPGYEAKGFLKGRSPRQTSLRPGTPEHARAQPKYEEAFLNYIRTGRAMLGLQVGKDNKGGYLAPIAVATELIKFLDNAVWMRQICNVLPPLGDAVSIGIPTWDTDPNDADWTAEVPASDISEDDAARAGRREMMPHLMSKLVKVSMKLMRSSVIDPWALLTERLGYKFAITEEQGFLTGSGAQQPLGVFTASADGLPTSRDVTASSATAWTADDLVNTMYNVKGQYQQNGAWIFSRQAVRNTRKLKDGNGQYIWQLGLAGTPSTVLDRPYYISEYVNSTFTTGRYVCAFGDFKAGYWIADSLGMELQQLNELFALKNQVGVVGRKETDGAPVLQEALTRLVLA
jgi:HK97 family phage major capsid protein